MELLTKEFESSFITQTVHVSIKLGKRTLTHCELSVQNDEQEAMAEGLRIRLNVLFCFLQKNPSVGKTYLFLRSSNYLF